MEKIREFKQKLLEGEVTFSFKKKDGTIREARGTLKADLFPNVKTTESKEPTKKRAVAEDIICYYDLDKTGWRSFRFDQLIG